MHRALHLELGIYISIISLYSYGVGQRWLFEVVLWRRHQLLGDWLVADALVCMWHYRQTPPQMDVFWYQLVSLRLRKWRIKPTDFQPKCVFDIGGHGILAHWPFMSDIVDGILAHCTFMSDIVNGILAHCTCLLCVVLCTWELTLPSAQSSLIWVTTDVVYCWGATRRPPPYVVQFTATKCANTNKTYC